MATQFDTLDSSSVTREQTLRALETYRVVIRLEKVRENLSYSLGSRPTDAEVIRWLCGLGFVPATDGNAWIGAADSLERLRPSEVVRVEQLESWYDCYPDQLDQQKRTGLVPGLRSATQLVQSLYNRLFGAIAPPL